MTTERVLEELTDAAGRLGLEVRTEKGNFDGGRCRIGGEEVVMLNKRHLPEHRLAVLARALRAEEMEAVYLPPAVRKALADVWAEQHQEDAPAGNDASSRDATAAGDASTGNASTGNASTGNASTGNASTADAASASDAPEEATAHAE